MQDFIFGSRPEIYFGSGYVKDMVSVLGRYGNRFLLVFGKKSVFENGAYGRITSAIKERNLEWEELWGVEPNPQVGKVREGIDLVRRKGIDCVLGIGGGSVLDTVKAIAVGVPYHGDVWDFFSGKTKPKEMLPYGCVVTTVGSGSEVSRGCVLSNRDIKRSQSHDFFRPKFSLVDLKAMECLSTDQILPGCMDILVHVTERYFSDTPHIEYTDALCLVTVKHIVRNMKRIKRHEEWEEAVKEIAYLSIIAQEGYLASGRRTDGACHQLEHVLSGVYGVSHTVGIALVFFNWVRKVSAYKREKFEKLFESMFGKEVEVEEGIKLLSAFYDEMGLTCQYGIKGDPKKAAQNLAEVCVEECGRSTVGNFMELDQETIAGIYAECLKGNGGRFE